MKHLMRILFFIACVWLGSITGLKAQKSRPLKLSVANHSFRQSGLSSIDIVINLPDSVFLGVVPSDISNTNDRIVAEGGVGQMLSHFVNEEYASAFSPSGVKLLWTINHFAMGIDSSQNSRTAYVKIGAAVSNADSLDTYHPLGNFDTVLINNDKEVDLAALTVAAINSLYDYSEQLVAKHSKVGFLTSSSKLPDNMAAKNSFTKEQLIEDIQKQRNWRILSDSVRPKGIYRSFQEFKNNAPSIQNFYLKVDTTTKQVSLYQFSVTDSSANKVDSAWGLSINNELYKYSNGHLYAIEKSGNGFVLSKYLNYMTRKNQAIFWRRYVGNRQGDDNPYDDAHIYRIPVFKNSPAKVQVIRVDMSSGNLGF